MKLKYEYSTLSYSTKMDIFQKDEAFFIKLKHTDGSSETEEMNTCVIKEGMKLEYKEGYNGEYFILQKDGTLEFYNEKNVKFKSLKPLS